MILLLAEGLTEDPPVEDLCEETEDEGGICYRARHQLNASMPLYIPREGHRHTSHGTMLRANHGRKFSAAVESCHSELDLLISSGSRRCISLLYACLSV